MTSEGSKLRPMVEIDPQGVKIDPLRGSIHENCQFLTSPQSKIGVIFVWVLIYLKLLNLAFLIRLTTTN